MPPDAIGLFERLVFIRGHYVLRVTVSHCLETQEGLCSLSYYFSLRSCPQTVSRDLGKIGSGSFGAIHLGTGAQLNVDLVTIL